MKRSPMLWSSVVTLTGHAVAQSINYNASKSIHWKAYSPKIHRPRETEAGHGGKRFGCSEKLIQSQQHNDALEYPT